MIIIENGRLLSIGEDDIQNGNFIVPEEVTEISASVFLGYTNLTSITLPTGLTALGSYAFEGCSGLTAITLPAGLTTIGAGAFYGCSGLTAITLPAGLTTLGTFAFFGCSGLTTITLPEGLITIGNNAFYGCRSLATINLPAGVTTIGNGAFFGCSGLTTITLPEGLITIGDCAFGDCRGLTTITLPPGIKLHPVAFSGCDHLEMIIIDSDDIAQIEAVKAQLPQNLKGMVNARDISLQSFNASVLLTVLSGFMAALGAAALLLAFALSWTPAVATTAVVTGVALLAGSYGLFKYANTPSAVPIMEEQSALFM